MQKKILIVDDEPDIRLLLKSRLTKLDHEVEMAVDGADGLEKIKQIKPDLIIMDVLMPKMTGYQVLEAMRDLSKDYRRIPVIVMSARPSMKDFFDSFMLVSFIPKPFDAQRLMTEVQKALGDHQSKNLSVASTNGSSSQGASVLETSKESSKDKSTEAQKKLLMIGNDEYILGKMKGALEAKHFKIQLATSEKIGLDMLRSNAVDAILCEFWEDVEIFDTVSCYKKIKELSHAKNTPLLVFCKNNLLIDAKQKFKALGVPILSYHESPDLLPALEQFVTTQLQSLK